MMELRRKERDCIAMLERRLEYLQERIKTSEPKFVAYDRQERKALLWALEVIEQAAATNCEEAFAYTTLRAPPDEEAKRAAAYLQRSLAKEKARAAKAEAEMQAKAGSGHPAPAPPEDSGGAAPA